MRTAVWRLRARAQGARKAELTRPAALKDAAGEICVLPNHKSDTMVRQIVVLRANLHSNLLAVYSQRKFFRCAGLTRWRLAAQGTSLAGRRARKSGWKSVFAQNRRSSSRWTRKSRRGAPTLQATHAQTGKEEKDPTQAGTQMTAWRLSANVRPCFWVSWNVYVRVCGCLDLRVFGFGCLGNLYSKLCVLTVEIRHFRFAGRCPAPRWGQAPRPPS